MARVESGPDSALKPDPGATTRRVTIGARTWFTGAAIFALALFLWLTLASALSALILLFTGVLIAVALRPIIVRLQDKMPFGAAVGVAFAAVALVAVVIAAIVIAPLGAEVQRLFQALPGYVSSLRTELTSLQRFVKNDQLASQVAGTLANSAGGAFSALGAHILGGSALVASLVGNVAIVLLLAVGWALSSDQLESFALSLLPPAAKEDWKRAIDDIGARLAAYVQGVVINGAVVGIGLGGLLAILGVPYALLLGFIAALLQAIPMVGAVISGPIVVLVVLATSGWVKMLIALAIFVVIQILDQNLLSPIIFGQRVRLSFLLIIFSTVVGGMLLGIPGAFLAVPAAAALQVIVVQIIAPAIRTANQVGADDTPDRP
jgi:predicted PurR-regulated permease PerM